MPMIDSFNVTAGRQSAWDTGVADAARLMGITDFSLNPQVTARVIGLNRGGYAPGSSAVIMDIQAAMSMSQELTYEDIHFWTEAMFGTVTPTGTTPTVARVYAAPLSTAVTPIPMTFYYGDGVIAPYRIIGALPNNFTISGTVGEEVTISGDWSGRTVAASTTTSPAERVANPVMMHHLVDVTVDTWAGTIGTTNWAGSATAANVYGFELAVTAEKPTRRYAGQTAAALYNQRKWAGTLRLDVDFNAATTKAILDLIAAGAAPVQRLIRMRFVDGTRLLEIDFAGTVMESPVIFDDDDGVAVMPITFQGTYNSTATMLNWLKIKPTSAITAAGMTAGTMAIV